MTDKNNIYREDEKLSTSFKDLWLNEHDIGNKIGSGPNGRSQSIYYIIIKYKLKYKTVWPKTFLSFVPNTNIIINRLNQCFQTNY